MLNISIIVLNRSVIKNNNITLSSFTEFLPIFPHICEGICEGLWGFVREYYYFSYMYTFYKLIK
jgi:hypothetical protein